MRMFRSRIYMKASEKFAAQRVLGQHSAHGMLDETFRMLRTDQRGSVLALTARIPGVRENDAVSPFLARHPHLLGIDNNDIVATIHMRRITRLVLPTNDFRNLTGYAALYLRIGVDNNPAFFCCRLVGISRLITIMIHFFA